MKYYLYNKFANNGNKPELPEGAEVVQAVGLDYKKFFHFQQQVKMMSKTVYCLVQELMI